MSKPGAMTILIEDMPRALVDRVKAKGRAEEPPIPMKWIVRLLLEGYAAGTLPLPTKTKALF